VISPGYRSRHSAALGPQLTIMLAGERSSAPKKTKIFPPTL
jgi:hypothetical protein